MPDSIDKLSVKHVSYNELMDNLYSSEESKVYRIDSYKYNASANQLQFDYNIPSSYLRYSSDPNKRHRKPNTSSEPYIRSGHDNKYPFFILRLLKLAHTHKRAYKTAVNIAYGKGLSVVEEEGGEDGSLFLNWLGKIGVNNYNFLKESLQSIASFGGSYVHKVFSDKINIDIDKVEVTDKTISTTKFLSQIHLRKYFSTRIGKREVEGKDIGKVLFHWEHPSFNEKSPRKALLKGIKVYESFDKVNPTEVTIVKQDKKSGFFEGEDKAINNLGRYSFLIREPNLFSVYYPEPAWETNSSIAAIMVEDALGAMDIGSMQNGMMAGFIVTVEVADTSSKDKRSHEEKKSQIETKIRDELQGVDNADQIVVVFKDPRSKENVITIAEIPHTNTSDMQQEMELRKLKAILTAWGVIDERLIGSPPVTAKGMSSQADALAMAEDLWYDNVIDPEIIHPLVSWIFEELLPIWMSELNRVETTITEVLFIRKRLFSRIPPKEVLQSSYGIDETRAMHGDGPATDEVKQEIKDRNKNNNSNTGEGDTE